MNMGPGQAKQCQLRAFLTYYINDLFLNQVSEIKCTPLIRSDREAYLQRCFSRMLELSQKKTFFIITILAVRYW